MLAAPYCCEILSRRDVKTHLFFSEREAPNQIRLVKQWSLGGSLQELGWLWELLHRKSHPQHGGLRKGSSTEESHPQPIICVLKRLGEGRGFVGKFMSPLGFPIQEAMLTGLISWGFLGDHSCSAFWQWSCLIQREQLHLPTVYQSETLVSVKSAGRTSKRRLLWRCKEYTVDLGLPWILNTVSFPGIRTGEVEGHDYSRGSGAWSLSSGWKAGSGRRKAD